MIHPESEIRLKIAKSFRLLGFLDRHEQDFGPTFVNRPDLFCYNFVGPTVVTEVKRILPLKRDEPHFDLPQIKDGQRDWMDWATYDCGAKDNIFLGLGTSYDPERAWLIPWYLWVEFEFARMNNDNDYKVPIGSIDTVFPDYELVPHPGFPKAWKNGLWDLEHHSVSLFSHDMPHKFPKPYPARGLRFGKG